MFFWAAKKRGVLRSFGPWARQIKHTPLALDLKGPGQMAHGTRHRGAQAQAIRLSGARSYESVSKRILT